MDDYEMLRRAIAGMLAARRTPDQIREEVSDFIAELDSTEGELHHAGAGYLLNQGYED